MSEGQETNPEDFLSIVTRLLYHSVEAIFKSSVLLMLWIVSHGFYISKGAVR
jgi:hypothetical protein